MPIRTKTLAACAILSLGIAACATQQQEQLGVAEAERMITEAFPDTSVAVTSAEPDGERVRAAARLDDGDVFVLFAQVDGGGWRIDGIEQDGTEYSVADLRAVAETVNRLAGVSDALSRFREATGEFPALPDMSGLQALVPDYRDAEDLRDGWDRPFRYSRQGTEYTMTSDGPDGIARTADDLIVVTGRFVTQLP